MPQLYIFLGAIARLLPHPANFSPITAMAFFGGAHLPRRQAFVIPVLSMVIGDIGLHFTLGYPLATWSTLFVYASFALIVLLGQWFGKKKSSGRFFTSAAASSALFFVITNFGTWLTGGLYPMTPAGLVSCFIAAIPFLRNTIVGDAAWIGIFFGSFAITNQVVALLVRNKSRLAEVSA